MLPTFLQSEVFPTDVQVIRAEPVTTKLSLTAREFANLAADVKRGWPLLRALESIQTQRAFLASFPNGAPATRARFRAFLADPATGPTLDAMLADNAAVDAALVTVCAWCPSFDPSQQAPGVSHGMCADCAARFANDADVSHDGDDRGDEDRGSTCGAACGYCGGCS